jgi:hypothetical protein
MLSPVYIRLAQENFSLQRTIYDIRIARSMTPSKLLNILEPKKRILNDELTAQNQL